MTGKPLRSIDTNILLRHLLGDHAEHSPRASTLMLAVRRGDERIFCPATVIFEAVHVLQGLAGLPRADIAAALTNLIRLPDFVMSEEDVLLDALAFWTDQSPRDFADCYHLALTRALGMTAIYTFDRKMDRYPGVERACRALSLIDRYTVRWSARTSSMIWREVRASRALVSA